MGNLFPILFARISPLDLIHKHPGPSQDIPRFPEHDSIPSRGWLLEGKMPEISSVLLSTENRKKLILIVSFSRQDLKCINFLSMTQINTICENTGLDLLVISVNGRYFHCQSTTSSPPHQCNLKWHLRCCSQGTGNSQEQHEWGTRDLLQGGMIGRKSSMKSNPLTFMQSFTNCSDFNSTLLLTSRYVYRPSTNVTPVRPPGPATDAANR